MRAHPRLALAAIFVLGCTTAAAPAPPKRRASPAAEGGPRQPFSAADYEQHVAALKVRTGNAFGVRIEAPFVVIGDEMPVALEAHAKNTVRWATVMLKQDFFDKDPEKILDVWLFKDARSYEDNVLALFGERPTTPYGYYSSANGGLIMNIATGGGTLVHEIVHPFMEANFPECPAWFNEGLGSLYEQCGEEDGHIHGYPNWRLPSLQKAIRAGRVPSFKDFTSMSTRAFYDEDRGTNYAQARYLCYYLQEEGLLVKFYREFHAHADSDPTGYETLKGVLRAEDMDKFKRRWEAFVLTLSFP
jgi:hypothetical protein